MSSPWTPRRYEPGDETKIDELLRLCHGHHHPGLEYWSWVFKKNPLGFHGTEGDIWVAETSTGNLIGYYGRIRVPMWFKGKSIVGSQVAMLATHPDYRRQGVFETLSVSALEDAKKNGIGVAFGFPNAFSYPGSVKHGWVDFGIVKDLVWVLDSKDFLKRIQRNSVTKLFASVLLSFAAPRLNSTSSSGHNPDFEVIPGFMEDAGVVWDSLKHEYDLGIERTKAYLEWRYHRTWGDYQILSAVRGSQTLGYVVFRIASTLGAERGYICELMSTHDNVQVYQTLLREIWRRSRAQGIISLSASSSCSRGLHAVLRGTRSRILTLTMKRLRQNYGHSVALFLQEGQRVQPGRLRWYHSIGDRDFG
jgi:GNAT superfamily N-acetyltransferase